jgi:cytochrome P450
MSRPSYKPFGGGVTLCPGRNVAKQKVFVFVHQLLHRLKEKLAALGGETGVSEDAV